MQNLAGCRRSGFAPSQSSTPVGMFLPDCLPVRKRSDKVRAARPLRLRSVLKSTASTDPQVHSQQRGLHAS